jgi:hypothetical protein
LYHRIQRSVLYYCHLVVHFHSFHTYDSSPQKESRRGAGELPSSFRGFLSRGPPARIVPLLAFSSIAIPLSGRLAHFVGGDAQSIRTNPLDRFSCAGQISIPSMPVHASADQKCHLEPFCHPHAHPQNLFDHLCLFLCNHTPKDSVPRIHCISHPIRYVGETIHLLIPKLGFPSCYTTTTVNATHIRLLLLPAPPRQSNPSPAVLISETQIRHSTSTTYLILPSTRHPTSLTALRTPRCHSPSSFPAFFSDCQLLAALLHTTATRAPIDYAATWPHKIESVTAHRLLWQSTPVARNFLSQQNNI